RSPGFTLSGTRTTPASCSPSDGKVTLVSTISALAGVIIDGLLRTIQRFAIRNAQIDMSAMRPSARAFRNCGNLKVAGVTTAIPLQYPPQRRKIPGEEAIPGVSNMGGGRV